MIESIAVGTLMTAKRQEDQHDTQVWRLVSVDGGSFVGEVKYMKQWEQYCFYPGFSVYSHECLNDIRTLCRRLTVEHNEATRPKC